MIVFVALLVVIVILAIAVAREIIRTERFRRARRRYEEERRIELGRAAMRAEWQRGDHP